MQFWGENFFCYQWKTQYPISELAFSVSDLVVLLRYTLEREWHKVFSTNWFDLPSLIWLFYAHHFDFLSIPWLFSDVFFRSVSVSRFNGRHCRSRASFHSCVIVVSWPGFRWHVLRVMRREDLNLWPLHVDLTLARLDHRSLFSDACIVAGIIMQHTIVETFFVGPLNLSCLVFFFLLHLSCRLLVQIIKQYV